MEKLQINQTTSIKAFIDWLGLRFGWDQDQIKSFKNIFFKQSIHDICWSSVRKFKKVWTLNSLKCYNWSLSKKKLDSNTLSKDLNAFLKDHSLFIAVV